MFEVKGALSSGFQQLPLNSNPNLELFIHASFEERRLFDV